jgi:hypothetical protein
MSMPTKKVLVFGVIFLFIAISFSSTINAENNYSKENEFFKVEITEYKSDGTIERSVKSLKKVELLDLKRDILGAKTIEEKLSVFKGKGLISQNVLLSDLEQGMHQKAEKYGISKNLNPSGIKIRPPILLTLLSTVNTFYFGGGSLSFGLSPLIRLINWIIPIGLFGIDIVNFAGGAIGVTHTVDLFYKQTMITFPGFTSMVGFVGYSFKIPTTMHVFIGFSVATFGLGLGIKLKEWVF